MGRELGRGVPNYRVRARENISLMWGSYKSAREGRAGVPLGGLPSLPIATTVTQ